MVGSKQKINVLKFDNGHNLKQVNDNVNDVVIEKMKKW